MVVATGQGDTVPYHGLGYGAGARKNSSAGRVYPLGLPVSQRGYSCAYHLGLPDELEFGSAPLGIFGVGQPEEAPEKDNAVFSARRPFFLPARPPGMRCLDRLW